ncbi:MAG: hypothetical protein OXN17_18150 [Candidatus Poribacteria bacterium]|nr:hypothetical protein [Candidatus Poribacteria bacterium]MDE0505783.1 hypothetical protein [Candidatus Poribacteria bacterium]
MSFRFFLANLVLYLFCIVPLSAVTTSIWEQSSQKDFEAGTLKDVSVTSEGDVLLARKIGEFAELKEEIYVWSLAEDSIGNVYAGTGNQGKIYRIAPDGQPSLFYDSPEISILSLTIDANDHVYAGTGPDGLIYKITDENVPPTTILSSEEKYVWALTFDESGNLYAATGTAGKIYKITSTGEATVFFDSEETNIRSLLFHENALYAGSGGKGIIYRISTDGTASVVHQTAEKEVPVLIAGKDGKIYGAAITSAPPQPGSQNRPSPPPPSGGGPPEEKKSHIYQIGKDGVVSKIWTAPAPLILSMVFEGEDQLLIGTGDEGKIYKVDIDGDSISLGKCEAGQILAMHRAANTDRLLLGTGNSAKLYELTAEYKTEGTIESQPRNTQAISRWGKLRWEAVLKEGASITFATRSGNTKKPDNTWSEWSGELANSDGEQITSPSARYIQWRAKLSTNDSSLTPMLNKVVLASAQANIEPRFTKVEIQMGNESKEPGAPPNPRPRDSGPPKTSGNQSKQRTVQWKAEDLNKDVLQFAVYYKRIDEENWRLLKKELTTTSYNWDTTSMPDGRYIIKIEATDKLSNPPAWAKSSEEISKPFDIDNTQPTVGDVVATANGDGTYKITCTTEDESSHIQKAVYKIDGDEHWKVIFPEDGIFDSKKEMLLLQTRSLAAGAHTITIQVTDASENVAVGGASFAN